MRQYSSQANPGINHSKGNEMNHDPEQPIDPPESIDTPERDFERDALSLAFIDAQVQQVNHDFPLDIRIKGLLTEIAESDRVPVQQTIDVLHAMLAFIDENDKTITRTGLALFQLTHRARQYMGGNRDD